jgi:hypothetical protein
MIKSLETCLRTTIFRIQLEREAAKRLDYLVRAVPIEKLPLIIKKRYEEKTKQDRERYDTKQRWWKK